MTITDWIRNRLLSNEDLRKNKEDFEEGREWIAAHMENGTDPKELFAMLKGKRSKFAFGAMIALAEHGYDEAPD